MDIRINDRGINVLRLQKNLKNLGFSLKVNGYFGIDTLDIILNIQKKFPESLTPNGICDLKTFIYIRNLNNNNYKIIKNPHCFLTLVNKQNSLPHYYVPTDLVCISKAFPKKLIRRQAAKALFSLIYTAKKSGMQFSVVSAYRSYKRQSQIFAQYYKDDPTANIYSARPGESEHQTGLAIDLSSPVFGNQLEEDFASTPEGIWLQENAYRFGFIIRYPKGKEAITGYQYEPWHIRYTGKMAAMKITEKNITLEEFKKEYYHLLTNY